MKAVEWLFTRKVHLILMVLVCVLLLLGIQNHMLHYEPISSIKFKSHVEPNATVVAPTIETIASIKFKSHVGPSNEENATIAPTMELPPQCVIHISGLPRTGTGVLQRAAIEAVGLNQSSWFNVHSIAEYNEGHLFATKLVPFSFNANRAQDSPCFSPLNNFTAAVNAHICPVMQPSYVNCSKNIKQRFWNSWADKWELNKTYLFQKTPSMRMWLLDACFPSKHMVHLITLRHPLFYWSMSARTLGARVNPPVLVYLQWWLEVWSFLIDNGFSSANSYVIRFETMFATPHVLDFLPQACGHNVQQRRRRQLELRNNGELDLSLVWKSNIVAWWNACLNHGLCRLCLVATEPAANVLGYTMLNTNQPLTSTAQPVYTRDSHNNSEAFRTSLRNMKRPCVDYVQFCHVTRNARHLCHIHDMYKTK